MSDEELKKVANEVRKGIVTGVHAAKSGHPGGSLGAADIMTYLYFEEMNVDPADPRKADRDRFVLSKGHCAPGLYAVLAERGFFPKEDLETLRHIGSHLQGHPNMNDTPGVDMSTGSLGQGISAAVGMAVAAKHWGDDYRTYALLGDGAAAALQTANWEEWSDFVETLSAWMAEPKAATVTLSGADYTLPDARPGSLTATGVFAAPLDRASGYTAALLAADGTYTADALTGPLNGVYSAVTLEWDHMAADGGEGIFRRAKLTDLLAEYGADTCNGLVLVPFKCQLDDSDLTAEDYNAEGLLNYPVLADVGSIAINAGTSADGLKAAKSAALWLYSNGAGEDALTETLGVVTPWNTAAGTTAVTAMQVQQVGTGILPGVALDTAAADALTANELTLQDSEKHTKAERTAFVDGALAALGAE